MIRRISLDHVGGEHSPTLPSSAFTYRKLRIYEDIPMLHTMTSPALGRRCVVAGLTAVSLSLAACSDAATAPQAASVARDIARPSEVVLSVATFAKVRVIDIAGKTLTSTGWVRFTTTDPADTVEVLDNTAKDYDPAVGVVKAALKPGKSYKACFTFNTFYRGESNNPSFPSCSTVTSKASQIDMGNVVARRSPQFTFLTKNEFNQLIGGASFSVSVPGWSLTMSDGQWPYDQSPGADGNLTYVVNYPNMTTWCEVSPPPKYLLTSAKCGTVTTSWEGKYTFILQHEKLVF
jgi:hypothetical protein